MGVTLCVLGALLVVAGVGLLSVPAGLIVAGLAMLGFAVLFLIDF